VLDEHRVGLTAKLGEGGCIPVNDRSGEEGQTGGARDLILEGAVPYFSEAIEEEHAGERVPGLSGAVEKP